MNKLLLIPIILLLSLGTASAVKEMILNGEPTMIWNGTRDGNNNWTTFFAGGTIPVTNGTLLVNYSSTGTQGIKYMIYNSSGNRFANMTIKAKVNSYAGGILDVITLNGNGDAYSNGCMLRCNTAGATCTLTAQNVSIGASSSQFGIELGVWLNWTMTYTEVSNNMSCKLYRNGVLNATVSTLKANTGANLHNLAYYATSLGTGTGMVISELWTNLASYINPCSSGTSGTTLAANILDEIDNTLLKARLNDNILIINNNTYINHTQSGASSYYFCIYPSTASYNTTVVISYDNSSANYNSRYYFLNNVTLSNSTQAIELYLLSSTDATSTPISVIDETGRPVSNVLVIARREYVSLNAFRSVSMAITDDSGYTSMPLEWNNVRYDFQIINTTNNRIIKQSNPLVLTTLNAAPLTISTSIGQVYDYWNRGNNLVYNTSYVNVSNIINYTVNALDTSGLSTSIKLTCNQVNMVNVTLLYSSTVNGNSISSTCVLGNVTGKNFLIVTIITYSDGTMISRSETIDNTTYYNYGIDGLLSAFFIIISLALGLSVSPAASIMGLIVGLVVLLSLGFTLLSINAIMMMIFALLFILWVVRRGR